jgi:hypothetical protein
MEWRARPVFSSIVVQKGHATMDDAERLIEAESRLHKASLHVANGDRQWLVKAHPARRFQ